MSEEPIRQRRWWGFRSTQQLKDDRERFKIQSEVASCSVVTMREIFFNSIVDLKHKMWSRPCYVVVTKLR